MDILEHSVDNGNGIGEQPLVLKSEEIESKPVNDLIIEEEGSLSDDGGQDGLPHAQTILDTDESVQYQWKSNEGVTYRVLQVSPTEFEDDELRASIVQQNTAAGSTQPVMVASNIAGGNHFYVVNNEGSVTGVLPRPLVPRASVVLDTRSGGGGGGSKVRRDDKRRATHNEVERRRRDKINNWIAKLSKIIPECGTVDNKTLQSKGGILATACDYIVELKEENAQLQSCKKEKDRLASHINYLQQQNEKLKMENAVLRNQLRARFPNTESSENQQEQASNS